jgi:predicted MarR family transcription regulator
MGVNSIFDQQLKKNDDQKINARVRSLEQIRYIYSNAAMPCQESRDLQQVAILMSAWNAF